MDSVSQKHEKQLKISGYPFLARTAPSTFHDFWPHFVDSEITAFHPHYKKYRALFFLVDLATSLALLSPLLFPPSFNEPLKVPFCKENRTMPGAVRGKTSFLYSMALQRHRTLPSACSVFSSSLAFTCSLSRALSTGIECKIV